jgi:hypothetical protein
MDKLLEILRQHKDIVSYILSFSKPETLTLQFKDGSKLILCETSTKKI